MLYLSPVWHTLPENKRARFGYIQSPHGAGVGQGIIAGHPWMLDNGAFSDKWTEASWLVALERWQPYAGTCIAAVCPDVVGDAGATLARFKQYAPIIKQYGYPVAFVTQDGLQMADVPWSDFDVLFVGGTDKHKLKESYPFIAEAKRRGLWVHVGRVNSAKRIEAFWMADSVDGTTLAREPSPQVQTILLNAAKVAAAKKGMVSLWAMS
jgi:hypothetical protein